MGSGYSTPRPGTEEAPAKPIISPFDYDKREIDEIIEKSLLIPMFDKFTPAQIRLIAMHMQIKHLAERQRLFSEGDSDEDQNYMAFIASGRLEESKLSVHGKSITVSTLSHGSSVGEMAMINSFPRSVTVRAIDSSILLLLTRENFERIAEHDIHVAFTMLKALTNGICLHLSRTSAQFADAQESAEACQSARGA